MPIVHPKLLRTLGVFVGLFAFSETRLMAQGIDAQTLQFLRQLLSAGVLQLMFVALVLIILVVGVIVVMLWRRGGEQYRFQERLFSFLEKRETSTDELRDAILELKDSQRATAMLQQQAVDRHTANSGAITEGIRATQALSASTDLLSKNMVSWSKLLDDSVSAVRSELVRLVSEFLKFREQQDALVASMNTEQRDVVERIVRDGNILILAKLDEILQRLPPPPPLPHDQTPAEPSNILHADAGAQAPDIPFAS